ncbi:MAG TPA: nucleotidyltransferase domain-containing protein [Candidatus Lokiarchaeia archaeon]
MMDEKKEQKLLSRKRIKKNYKGFLKIEKILEEVKFKVKSLYGDKLKSVILYGSYARGEEKQKSDIDIAVILKGDFELFKEIDRIIDVTYDIGLNYSVLLSIKPISEQDYDKPNTILILNLIEDGILI